MAWPVAVWRACGSVGVVLYDVPFLGANYARGKSNQNRVNLVAQIKKGLAWVSCAQGLLEKYACSIINDADVATCSLNVSAGDEYEMRDDIASNRIMRTRVVVCVCACVLVCVCVRVNMCSTF